MREKNVVDPPPITGDLAIEGFTCLIIFKNFFSFGLTFKAYDWILENHTRGTPVFNALGSVQVVVCLLSIPMCMSFRDSALPPEPLRETFLLTKRKQISTASGIVASSIATISSRCLV